MRKKIIKTAYAAALLGLVVLMFSVSGIQAGAYTEDAVSTEDAGTYSLQDPEEVPYGGGYAASGQIGDVGYSSEIYDAVNGLPTSDANYILSSSDGYIWIGAYSGVIRYDGSSFTRLDTSEGLTNARGLFEDDLGRIWVGTNDNGVVVLDGGTRTHITYKDGLPSSSIRVFAQDNDGNVYIGTTSGVCYADRELQIHPVTDDRIKDERILKLDSDVYGRIYGQTKNGLIFRIDNCRVTAVYEGKDLGIGKITSLLADPQNASNVYICTEGGVIYYGAFGYEAQEMRRISAAPITNIHWISYDCGRVWVSSINRLGYIDRKGVFHVLFDIPVNSGIEMMTSDYQGNMWIASSTQGVMKMTTNNFVDVYLEAGISPEVTNAVCIHDGRSYIGTDTGLRILDEKGALIENELTQFIGGARVRCIRQGREGELWIGTYTGNKGLVCLTKEGEIVSYNIENGMPGNEVRCVLPLYNGTVMAGTNDGIAVIKDGEVTGTFGEEDGMTNTIVLTVEQGDNGSVYVGTDGGGMYVINGTNVRKKDRSDGLTSDVIIRIKKDEERSDVYWIITSNSIEYMKDGNITEVTTFPYNNNYDLHNDGNGNIWVVSSCGIYIVSADDMIKDEVSNYRLYTVENGLISTPTSMSYCTASDDGYLYIPGRSGVFRVDTGSLSEGSIPLKASITSVYCGDELIEPDEKGTYRLPSSGGRISITASVLDYTLLNPVVNVYMEGKENEGITVSRNNLQPLEYTGLGYGNYNLHIRVLDGTGQTELLDSTYRIEKKPKVTELPFFRLLFILLVITVTIVIVWRVIKVTVVQRQYDEIRQARDDAERANTAKSRFLANMSHEIRTPISTIMGMNEMALREDATGVPKPYFISMINYSLDIRNAAESLLSLVNDLLDMSKIESGKMNLVEQEYDIQEMLRSVVSMIRGRSTEKELTFDVVIDEILPVRLYGDPGKIKQIVLNLLTNALKYTETGGFSLNVSMEERKNDECRLRFSVKDTGIGVRKEDMDKLFTAYERLDEQRNSGILGTGLGLDISRRFAELMGGSLTCESVYGEGSEFIFTVPQRIVDMSPVGVFREHDDSEAKGPYIPQFIAPDADILVVDDTPMNLSVIKGLLKATRVFVSTASSGEECLEKIRDTRFDVVLLDHMMPGMDGVETVAEIRKTDPDLPVYALTANSSAGEEFYISKGFNGYLSKPIDSRALENAIMKHLPEEMMKKPSAEDAVEELTEMPEQFMWIYETEGISAPEGIKNSGGIGNYIFSLNMFLDTIDANTDVIRKSIESDNIRLFTIKVHSLKSSARIIGALQLSEDAAKLEDAGNAGDKDYIADNTDRLLHDYEEFKEKLSGLRAEESSEDKEMISDKELKEAYAALSDVIPQMDYDSVELILDQLKGYALPPEDDRKMKEIARLLSEFDWDGLEELIGQ